MNLIEEGLKQGLIKFDTDQKRITYVHQKKSRNYNNPEEKVQADTFLKLVLIYKYKPDRIQQFVSVTLGSSIREADMIVYNDDKCESPHIVVECKKQDVSEAEFQQAIEQAFSYAQATAGTLKYVWTTSGIKDEFSEFDKDKNTRKPAADIPAFGVDQLANYKYAKGGGKVNGQSLFALNTVTEDDLTRRFKQAHDALWGGGEMNPSAAFDELDKLIFCKIWDERKARKKGVAYDFQVFTEDTAEKTNASLMKRVQALYNEGRKKDPEVFKEDVRLTPAKLRTVVGYLESINLSETDLDSKGRAFETFMGSFFRGDFGQYFTPRPIVKFIVDVLPIQHDSRVLDTSCGSGGFLLHALDKVRHQANEFYPDHETDPKEYNQHYKHWHDFAEKNLFGIEINEQIARTAKMNMIIHDDGHTNVIASDGLLPSEDVKDEEGRVTIQGLVSRSKNQGFKANSFDFIITNPPFGSSVKQKEKAYLHQYGLAVKDVDWLNPKSKASGRDNQSTEVLFIEQCHNFLKEGGWLAIVVPDGILTNSSLQYVRDNIEDMYRIGAVISMPQTAFSATGAGVKSSVLFLKKHTKMQTEDQKERKEGITDKIKDKHNYEEQLRSIDKEKKEHLKSLKGFVNNENLTGKALTQSQAFKDWKKETSDIYKQQIDDLKEQLTEEYLQEKSMRLDDYPIFMAIAEDIGYDATGKPTNNNELIVIGKELQKFIATVS